MKVTAITTEVNSERMLDVAFDVGKDKLNSVFEIGQRRYEDEFGNRSSAIRRELKSYMEQALANGFETLRVLCEPTAGYERALLKIAHQLGCRTAYVGGEASHKFRMVVYGDPGKTDTRDARPLLAVAAQGKLLTHRVLPAEYELLREINGEYDWNSKQRVMIRCEIHGLLVRLFPDMPMGVDFLYDAGGLAMAHEYGWNPKRIVAAGLDGLTECLKKACPRLRNDTVTKIWETAGESVQLHDAGSGADYVAERLQRHYEEYERLDRQRLVLCARLEEVYLNLREKDPRLPGEVNGVIKLYMLARIVAETGPLSDFRSIQQLYRLAGLNLCERKSGKYQGMTKISRKGRVALRRVLARAILPLVHKGKLYGEWYHTPDGKTKKGKGMAALMRKFLKMLFGWYKSGHEFDLKRVFTSAGDYAAQAA
jgi:transposase